MFDELEMDDEVDLWSDAPEIMRAAEKTSEIDRREGTLTYEAVFVARSAALVVPLKANHPGEALQEAWEMPDPEGFEYIGTRNSSAFGDWIY